MTTVIIIILVVIFILVLRVEKDKLLSEIKKIEDVKKTKRIVRKNKHKNKKRALPID